MMPQDSPLFSPRGERLYLTAGEDARFLEAARASDAETRLFCELLSYCGCRLSEALATTPRHLDADELQVVFRTLKRRRTVYRSVPVPARLMRELLHLAKGLGRDERLWPWCRQTGWRKIKRVMVCAGVDGPQASPKGLRHKFGVAGITQKIPEAAMQDFMGHAKASSTRIYTRVVGPERRALVRRMWRPRS